MNIYIYSNEHYYNNNRSQIYKGLRSRKTGITRTISNIPKESIPTLGIAL